jgi:ribosomal protein S27AE
MRGGDGVSKDKDVKLKWENRKCPTCGQTNVLFHGIEDDVEIKIWSCGHQRGMGRPV